MVKIIQLLSTSPSILVLSKYEDRDLDFKYIVQAADLLGKVLPETIVNPTWSGGSDKGRSAFLATILQRTKTVNQLQTSWKAKLVAGDFGPM